MSYMFLPQNIGEIIRRQYKTYLIPQSAICCPSSFASRPSSSGIFPNYI